MNGVFRGEPKSNALRERQICEDVKSIPGERILDVGFGSGLYLKHLGSRAQGIDINKENIKHAKAKGYNVMTMDSTNLGYNDKVFDTVLLHAVLEHLSIEDGARTLQEIRRVLVDDGLLILTTPEFNNQVRYFYNSYTHVTPYTEQSLRTKLSLYGFEIRSLKKTHHATYRGAGRLYNNWDNKLFRELVYASIKIYQHLVGRVLFVTAKKEVRT